ncbi:hypothetical protein SEMRO_82_G043950.1 [Seminavis robusta]|uniref:Uncharacterized protein n=1 Tax=Seminavis robusta TaxID=568900 RepID=A0A9N8DEL9_9STRA|nr:hypothetical protein SEMRO_82_G043950.1 [Seminavis robusta]|eukprot:Sro82_g043950.1 n/a (199) ;mRNA; f:84572-85168
MGDFFKKIQLTWISNSSSSDSDSDSEDLPSLDISSLERQARESTATRSTSSNIVKSEGYSITWALWVSTFRRSREDDLLSDHDIDGVVECHMTVPKAEDKCIPKTLSEYFRYWQEAERDQREDVPFVVPDSEGEEDEDDYYDYDEESQFDIPRTSSLTHFSYKEKPGLYLHATIWVIFKNRGMQRFSDNQGSCNSGTS